MSNKSVHPCPVCGEPLSLRRPAEFVIIYCGNGPCPSKYANAGEIATTEERAYELLKQAVNAEGPREFAA